jgi:hypothetical protein
MFPVFPVKINHARRITSPHRGQSTWPRRKHLSAGSPPHPPPSYFPTLGPILALFRQHRANAWLIVAPAPAAPAKPQPRGTILPPEVSVSQLITAPKTAKTFRRAPPSPPSRPLEHNTQPACPTASLRMSPSAAAAALALPPPSLGPAPQSPVPRSGTHSLSPDPGHCASPLTWIMPQGSLPPKPAVEDAVSSSAQGAKQHHQHQVGMRLRLSPDVARLGRGSPGTCTHHPRTMYLAFHAKMQPDRRVFLVSLHRSPRYSTCAWENISRCSSSHMEAQQHGGHWPGHDAICVAHYEVTVVTCPAL